MCNVKESQGIYESQPFKLIYQSIRDSIERCPNIRHGMIYSVMLWALSLDEDEIHSLRNPQWLRGFQIDADVRSKRRKEFITIRNSWNQFDLKYSVERRVT